MMTGEISRQLVARIDALVLDLLSGALDPERGR
jgi:hypothetical protein